MDFTIYTLGDNAMFRAVLTGVAMIFDPANSDTWVSTGGVGIGAAAALGLLLSLILLLFMAIQSQKFEMGLMIILVIAYAALFVPKFTVNLEDIYSGGVTKVDNIPLGIALPAALASNLAYDLGNKLETVFSTVDGNYLSQSSQGFLTPLKVLASLRNGWKQVYTRDPDLAASFVQYAQICGAGKTNQQALNTNQDPVGYLLGTPPTSGQTMYYSSTTGSYPNGTLMSCADAAAKLQIDTNSLVNDTSLTKVSDILNGAMDTGKGKDSSQGHTVGDLDTYLTAVTGGTVADAKALTALTLLQPLVNAGIGCQAGQNMQYCLQYLPAEEQRKEDAAAGGNFFIRTMKNGSNMFSFVIYAFSPIVALLLVATGAKGIKVAGSYLMLLIWVNSWMIFAALINYYIQYQIKNEFFMAGGAQVFLTPGGYLNFYDKLSQKIMLASDMMGMVPMLSLALISGSIYALTQVAGKWGADGIKSNYDEKVNSPQTMDGKAMVSRSSLREQNQSTGSMLSGVAQTKFNLGDDMSNAATNAETESTEAGVRYGKARKTMAEHGRSFDKAMAHETSKSQSAKKEYSKFTGYAHDIGTVVGDEVGEKVTENDVVGASAALTAKFGSGWFKDKSPIEVGAAISGELKRQKGWSDEKTKGLSSRLSENKQWSDGVKNAQTWLSESSLKDTWSSKSAENFKVADSEELSASEDRAEKAQHSKELSASLKSNSGLRKEFAIGDLTRSMSRPGLHNDVASLDNLLQSRHRGYYAAEKARLDSVLKGDEGYRALSPEAYGDALTFLAARKFVAAGDQTTTEAFLGVANQIAPTITPPGVGTHLAPGANSLLNDNKFISTVAGGLPASGSVRTTAAAAIDAHPVSDAPFSTLPARDESGSQMPKIKSPTPAPSTPATGTHAAAPVSPVPGMKTGITKWDDSKSTIEHVADWATDSFREDPWGTSLNVAGAAASFIPVAGWAGRGAWATYKIGSTAYRAAEVGSVAGVGVEALDAAAGARAVASVVPASEAAAPAVSTVAKVTKRTATAGAAGALIMAGAGNEFNNQIIEPQQEKVNNEMKEAEPRLKQARQDMATLRDRAAKLTAPKFY